MLCGTESSRPTPRHSRPVDLVPENLLDLLAERLITMLPVTKDLTPQYLRELFPTGRIYVCDAYVEGIENGIELPYGYERDGIVNIDHHAPTQAMMQRISSGNLALEFLKHHGPLTGNEQVVIHHLDCDSFVSSLLLRGILNPAPQWGEVVIAADHTGVPDPVADLLQSLAERRDMFLSAESVLKLSRGIELSPVAQSEVRNRLIQRKEAIRIVESGTLRKVGGVTWFVTHADVDGELVVPIIPDAAVIMVAVPFEGKPGFWVNRLRLGLAAPEGLSLLDLGIDEICSAWGGRWNAGSNRRGGGSPLAPEEFAKLLAERVQDWVLGRIKRHHSPFHLS